MQVFLPKYKMGKSETLPLQEVHWYPSGTSSHLVNEMLTSPTLDKMLWTISNLQLKIILFKLVLLDQIKEQSDEPVPAELLGWQHKWEAETKRIFIEASSKASWLLDECLSIALSLFQWGNFDFSTWDRTTSSTYLSWFWENYRV